MSGDAAAAAAAAGAQTMLVENPESQRTAALLRL